MLTGIFLTLLLVLLNGFFVAAEFAIVKVRASRLEIKAQSGNKIAGQSQQILESLDAYLSATQLGITIASLALGWIGESVVKDIIMNTVNLMGITLAEATAHSIAVPVAFIFITILHIVLGEQVPKTIAIRYPEPTTMVVTVPLKLFYNICKPLIWSLNATANFVLRLLKLKVASELDTHSAEELLLLLEQSRKNGTIQKTEHELIANVFYFKERLVKQIMVPRTNMVAIELPESLKEVFEIFVREGYSRIPVYVDNVDNIIGVFHSKDLLNNYKNKDANNIKELLRPAFFVPESKNISELLTELQRSRTQLAIVLDEFGGTAGLVTMEDIIEELVGEIQDEYDEEKPMVEKISETEFMVLAQAAISDVNESLPIPLPEDEDYDTVGGLTNVMFKRIPEVNDTAKIGPYQLTITKKYKRSVQAVRLILTKTNPSEF